jgi:LacI family transcriptional regulator
MSPRPKTPRSDTTEPAAPQAKAKAAQGKTTINDIARLSGVSKKTVSRVINGSELVHPETRDKVQALMEEMGYTPDPQARGLAFRHAFLIGLVFDNPTAQYIVSMQYGALDALRGSGFELVVHPCDSKQSDYIEGIKRFVQRQKLYGVILIPRVSEDQALADALQEISYMTAQSAQLAAQTAFRMSRIANIQANKLNDEAPDIETTKLIHGLTETSNKAAYQPLELLKVNKDMMGEGQANGPVSMPSTIVICGPDE